MTVDPTQPRPSSRRRRWRRRLLFAALVLLVVAVGTVQILLWTDIPRRIVVAQIQRQLGLRVTAASMQTGWRGRTVLRDVTLSLPLAEQALLEAPTLRARHTSLLPLLLGWSIAVDSLELDGAVLHVRQDQSGTWNIRQAVELAVRAAGAKQATQGSTVPSAVRLPDLRVNDGRIYIADNLGRTAVIDALKVVGWRSGTLVYNYDVALGKHLRLVGEIAPTARWDHEVRFAARELDQLLGPLGSHWPKNLNADGSWRGRLTSDGVTGRLELTSLSAAQISTSGVALIEWAGSSLQVRPDTLLLRTPSAAAGDIRVVSGIVTIESQAIRADDLLLALHDGQATVSGQFNRTDGSASIHAAWRQLAFPKGLSQSGQIQATLQTPWPGKPQITASIDASAQTEAGTLKTSLKVEGQGESFHDIDFKATVDHLAWAGRRNLQLNQLVAHLRVRGPQMILDDVAVAGHSHLDSRGQIDFNDLRWWLWLYGEDLPLLPNSARLDLNINTWGDSAYVKLQDFYLRSKDLILVGDGSFDSRLPKPLNVELRMDRLPLADAQNAEFIGGELASRVQLAGTVRPLDLELGGELRGRGLRIGQRAFGDVAVKLMGHANAEGGKIHTTELQLLGGRWQLAGDWPANSDRPVQLTANVRGLSLAEAGELFRTPAIGGNVDGEMTFSLPSLRLEQIEALGRFEAHDLHALPLVAEKATAELHLAEGVLRIAPIELRQADGIISASADVALARPSQWNIQATTRDWPIHLRSSRASAQITGSTQLAMNLSTPAVRGPVELSARLTAEDRPVGTLRVGAQLDRQTITAQHIEADALGGTLRGQASFTWKQPLQSTAQFNWDQIDTEVLADWFPRLTGLKGMARGSAQLAPTDSRHALGPLQLDVNLQLQDGEYRGMKIGNAAATVFFDSDRIVTEGSQFEFANGTLTLFARATRRPGEAITTLASIRFASLDLDQIVHAVTPDADPMPGRATGDFTLGGDPRIPRQMFGDGQLQLTHSELGNFDPIGGLYDLMHVTVNRAEPAGTARVQVRLEGNTLAIPAAHVFNRGIEIRAVGSISDIWDLPDSPLSGVAVGSARPLSNIKLPFMADVDQVLGVLQSNVTTVRVEGTVRKPKVQSATFDDIGEAMRKLLLGDVKAETRGSAGR